MDRPRRPEPHEPDHPSGQAPTPDVPVERPIPDAVDRQRDLDDPRPQEPTDSGDRTVGDHSTPSTDSSKETPASRPDEAQVDRPDEPSTRSVRDAVDSVDQRSRRDASSEVTQPSSDSTPTSRDESDQQPADLRAKMLQHPAFTRLGWGSGDEANSDGDDESGAGHGGQLEPRNSKSDEQLVPTRQAIERSESASDGGATRADAELVHVDEEVVGERASREAASELSETRADVESPNAKSADDADSSLDHSYGASKTEELSRDEATGNEPDPAVRVTGAEKGPDERRSAADHLGDETLDVVVGDETLGERLDRWDANHLNLSRPRSIDSAETDPETDQRSADESAAVAYIATNKEQRPWLAPAADCVPAVQSIYASLDQGSGHAHVRHGPALGQQALARRVARLEDPAQLDENLREDGVDGLDPTKMHRCGRYATAIVDANAFAAAVAVLSERPDVQDALASDWDGLKPDRLVIPIADVLGERGHEYCLGVRLAGNLSEALAGRKQWVLAKASGADLSALPEPRAQPIPTFEGGDIFVVFKRNHVTSKFEINTIFPNPPES
jgi:hypothetical protein